MFARHGVVPPFGLGPVLPDESQASEAHFEMGAKLFNGKIALQPPAFLSFSVEDQYGRRPERIETLEILRVFLYVNMERDKILFDERCQTGIAV